MKSAPKHRYNIEGGNQRGEDTRAKIVEAALKEFGERGFEGASMREIAVVAGVNAPALIYYFNNKEGLYLACAEYVVTRMWEAMLPAVEAAHHALKGKSDGELIDAFCSIQTGLAEYMLSPAHHEDWRTFIAREQSGLGLRSTFDVINDGFSKRLTNLSAAIVGRFLRLPAEDEECIVRSMTLQGQLLPFYFARRSTLSALNWDDISPDRLSFLVRIANEQAAAFLKSMQRKGSKKTS
jgi:AcrR family transcriptional regulator